MFRPSRAVLLVFFSVLLAIAPARAEVDFVGQSSIKSDGAVILRWMPEAWPEDVIGFELVRRPHDAESREEVWAHVEKVGPSERSFAGKASFLEHFDLDGVNHRTALQFLRKPDFLSKLTSAINGAVPADSLRLTHTFGLSYVDSGVDIGKVYDYALFPIYSDMYGSADKKEPMLSWRGVDVLYGGFTADVSDLSARWNADAKQVDVTFKVHKPPANSDSIVAIECFGEEKFDAVTQSDRKLASIALKTVPVEGNHWIVSAAIDIPEEDIEKLGFFPLDWYGKYGVMAAQFVVEKTDNGQGEIAIVKAGVKDSVVEILWKGPKPHGTFDIAGFHILRQVGSGTWERLTSSLLSPASRRFSDEDAYRFWGMDLSYRVEALHENGGRSLLSAPETVVLPGLPVLPPVQFEAELIPADGNGEVSVFCSWSPSLSNTVSWYEIQGRSRGDEEWEVLASFPAEASDATVILKEPLADVNKVVDLRSVAANREYTSNSSDIASLYLGMLNPPSLPVSFDVTSTQRRYRLMWDIADPKGIIGYRLFANGRMVADEEVLPPARCIYDWWSDMPTEMEHYVFELQVVGTGGVSRKIKAKPMHSSRN